MTLILVERLETVTGRLNSQPLWLVWVGIQMPSLAEIWQLYLRRQSPRTLVSVSSHKLCIGRSPKLSTSEQCERWSDLMPLLTWQLWLAKDVVTEICLQAAKISA